MVDAGPIAELRDGLALHELHDKKRPPGCRCAAVEDARDAGMVHHRKGLPLGLESRDHLARVHPELDHLQGDAPLNGRLLFREVDRAHAALTEWPKQGVRADLIQRWWGIRMRAG